MDAECQSFSSMDMRAEASRNSGSLSAYHLLPTRARVAASLLPENQSR